MALRSLATNLVAGDTNALADIFVRHLPGNAGAPLPGMALDKTALRFGAVTTGTALSSQTAAQVVRLTQSGHGDGDVDGDVEPAVAAGQPGVGERVGDLSISVVAVPGLPVGSRVAGAITLTVTGASNAPGPIAVSLNLIQDGTSARAVRRRGHAAGQPGTGVTGAIPFTGWALDDVEVTRVMVCRAAVGGEVAPVDPNCGGAAQIFVGFAVFIDGARPDVAALYPDVSAEHASAAGGSWC